MWAVFSTKICNILCVNLKCTMKFLLSAQFNAQLSRKLHPLSVCESRSTIFVDDFATKTLATSKFFVIETERQVVSLTWRYRTRTVSLAALRNPDSAVPFASEQSEFCTQFRTGWRRPSAITGMTSRRGSPRPWKDLGERERGRPCR